MCSHCVPELVILRLHTMQYVPIAKLYVICNHVVVHKRSCFTNCIYAVPPDFVTSTNNVRCQGSECAILTGATGYFQCSANGVPTPTVTLTNDTAVSDNVMVNGTRVTITNAVAGTVENFTCNASNIVNSVVQTYKLWVGGKWLKLNSDSQVIVTGYYVFGQ